MASCASRCAHQNETPRRRAPPAPGMERTVLRAHSIASPLLCTINLSRGAQRRPWMRDSFGGHTPCMERWTTTAVRARIAGTILATLLLAPARADETDQFTMPTDQPMADIGDFLDTLHCHALEEAVRD